LNRMGRGGGSAYQRPDQENIKTSEKSERSHRSANIGTANETPKEF